MSHLNIFGQNLIFGQETTVVHHVGTIASHQITKVEH
jgi:hypothetical protein